MRRIGGIQSEVHNAPVSPSEVMKSLITIIIKLCNATVMMMMTNRKLHCTNQQTFYLFIHLTQFKLQLLHTINIIKMKLLLN